MEPAVECTVEAGVATVVLRHPAKRNALTPRMWEQLPPLLARLGEDRAVGALVLTGHGETFSSGADISALRDPTTVRDLSARAEEAVAGFPKPSVAAVAGDCVGGGCQLAVACDLRFATADARFGVTPARLGIVYSAASTARLTRLVGPATATYLLFSAELIDTERAARAGLVDEVLPDRAALRQRVEGFTALLGTRSRLTQQAAKEFTYGPARPGRESHWDAQAAAEAAEGVAAFLERRSPRFEWRG